MVDSEARDKTEIAIMKYLIRRRVHKIDVSSYLHDSRTLFLTHECLSVLTGPNEEESKSSVGGTSSTFAVSSPVNQLTPSPSLSPPLGEKPISNGNPKQPFCLNLEMTEIDSSESE